MAEDLGRPLTEALLGERSPLLLEHVISSRLRQELAFHREAILVDLAHATMLERQGLLGTDGGALLDALRAQLSELGDEASVDPSFDSLLMQVERTLERQIGAELVGALRTGRSRIDHSAAVLRLAGRNRILLVHERLRQYLSALLDVAERHIDTVMPGWTQLQHAQPWTLGHYLVRHASGVERALERFEQIYGRTNLSSLGSGALVGTSWPIDRNLTSVLLGHDRPVLNTHDAGQFTVDWLLELTAALGISMLDAGRLASDLYVWASEEFGAVTLPDDLSGTSSAMPQKRNPVVLQFVRGWAGRATGWWTTTAGVARSATSTDADLPYVGTVIDEASDVTWRCIELMAEVVRRSSFDVEALRRMANAGLGTASELADELAKEFHVPLREAHRLIATATRSSSLDGVTIRDGDYVDRALSARLGRSVVLPTGWVAQRLDAARFIETRTTQGGPSRSSMDEQLAQLSSLAGQHDAWFERRVTAIAGGASVMGITLAQTGATCGQDIHTGSGQQEETP